jgi:flagellar biosynthesis protein FlhG
MSEWQQDQAAGLRRLMAGSPLRVLTLSGGARTGKTLLAANLAVALAARGRRVLVIDENGGMRSVAAMFGLLPKGDLLGVLKTGKPLESIVMHPRSGVALVPAAHAAHQLGNMSVGGQKRIMDALNSLSEKPDVVLIDPPPALREGALSLSLAAQEVTVVLTPAAEAITDAYRIAKVLSQGFGRRRFRVVVNRASESRASQIFSHFRQVADRFLEADLDLVGCIPDDPRLAQQGRPAVEAFPDIPAARALRAAADKLESRPPAYGDYAALEGFWQKLMVGGRATSQETGLR